MPALNIGPFGLNEKALSMNYILLFRIENECVYIARIVHQKQNYAELV